MFCQLNIEISSMVWIQLLNSTLVWRSLQAIENFTFIWKLTTTKILIKKIVTLVLEIDYCKFTFKQIDEKTFVEMFLYSLQMQIFWTFFLLNIKKLLFIFREAEVWRVFNILWLHYISYGHSIQTIYIAIYLSSLASFLFS